MQFRKSLFSVVLTVQVFLVPPLNAQENETSEILEQIKDKMVETMFRLDEDGDDRLTAKELETHFFSRDFKKIDTDENKFVTRGELTNHLEKMFANRRERQSKLGVKDPATDPIMSILDEDADGALSAVEIENASQKLLQLDKNRDGRLSRMELLMASPLFRKGPGQQLKPPRKNAPNESRTRLAHRKIKQLESACVTFKLVHGRFPKALLDLFEVPDGMTEREWRGPFMAGRLRADPWKNPYQYPADERNNSVKISSWGPDGRAGTSDDIFNSPPEKY